VKIDRNFRTVSHRGLFRAVENAAQTLPLDGRQTHAPGREQPVCRVSRQNPRVRVRVEVQVLRVRIMAALGVQHAG
jgi:hypothetical protein